MRLCEALINRAHIGKSIFSIMIVFLLAYIFRPAAWGQSIGGIQGLNGTGGSGGGLTTAGNGLTASGTTVSLATPVAVANGGTGAGSAPTARTNLGFPANHSYTPTTTTTGAACDVGITETDFNPSAAQTGNVTYNLPAFSACSNQQKMEIIAQQGTGAYTFTLGSSDSTVIVYVTNGGSALVLPTTNGNLLLSSVEKDPTTTRWLVAQWTSVAGAVPFNAVGNGLIGSGATVSLMTPVAVANGGTGAASVGAAQTNLGLGNVPAAAAASTSMFAGL